MPDSQIDNFADTHHLARLRERLWTGQQYGRAAVIVGAGISSNADRVGSGAARMPTFRELGERMFQKLHPLEAPGLSGAQDPVEVASDFEGIFGRHVLNDFLRSEIADGAYRPSRLHRLLVSLPWSDVFTTNYDTLLERATRGIVDRQYVVVPNHEALAGSSRPRIIKLHGSFPDHVPFVITKEDYRRYPSTHPGFVNTVRQSVMECAVCLLGFAGNDPNFIAWTGWVRDALGDAAPPIYLAGILDLNVQRRTILERRGVIPIDLSPVFPLDSWPDSSVRHRFANEWLLMNLAVGEPDPIGWPSASLRRASGAWEHQTSLPDLLPVQLPQHGTGNILGLTADLHRYPGWLACPPSSRRTLLIQLSSQGGDIDQALASEERSTALEAALALLEVSRIYGWPLSVGEVDRVAELVSNLFDHSDDWFQLAVGHLKQLRLGARWSEYDELAAQLREEARQIDTRNALLCSELARGEVSRLDYMALREITSDWPEIPGEFRLELARAAILVELGEVESARRVVSDVLQGVRGAIRHDELDIHLLATEGAAMTFLDVATTTMGTRGRGHSPDGRYRELSKWDCDPSEYFVAAERRLRKIAVAQTETTKSFDIGRSVVSTRLNDPGGDRVAEAISSLGLFENFSLPFRAGFMVFEHELALEAAKVLSATNPVEAFSVFVRAENMKSIDEVFDRLFVARASSGVIEGLHEIALRVIRQNDQARSAVSRTTEQRLAISFELASRLVARLESNQVSRLLIEALKQARQQDFSDTITLSTSVGNCISRCFETLPEDEQRSTIVKLLDIPMYPHDSVAAATGSWVDPLISLNLPKHLEERERDALEPRVSKLLAQARSTDVHECLPSFSRLACLSLSENLSDKQSDEFREVLWSRREANGEPWGLQLMLRGSWLLLPLPEGEDVGNSLRTRMLGEAIPDTDGQPGTERSEAERRAALHLRSLSRVLGIQKSPLSTSDATRLVQESLRWLAHHKSRESENPFFSSADKPIRELVSLLVEWVLPAIEENDEQSISLVRQLHNELQGGAIRKFQFEIAFDLQRLGVVEERDAEDLLIVGLASAVGGDAQAAARGMVRWLLRAPEPPDELRRRLIYYLHRPGGSAFPSVVVEIAGLVDNMSEQLMDLDVEWMVGAAEKLLLETDLKDRNNDSLYVDARWMPETRIASAQLASVIWRKFPSQRQRLEAWRQAASGDLLPEVRAIEWLESTGN